MVIGKNRHLKKGSKKGAKKSNRLGRILPKGRAKTPEQAMGSNDLESYCQRKSQDLIKEDFLLFWS